MNNIKSTIINILFKILGFVVCAAFILFLINIGFRITIVAPDNAKVYIDAFNSAYLSPPYVEEGYTSEQKSGLLISTKEEAEVLGCKPDPKCINAGGFINDKNGIISYALYKIGILNSLHERWDANGDWLW